MALFDVYLAVDWSASRVPKTGKDSIWLAYRDAASLRPPENPATRVAATARVRELLVAAIGRGARVLIGFDFPYGYPRGTAELVAPGEAPAWRRLWDELSQLVQDDATNANNRHQAASELNRRIGRPGPFWGSHGSVSPTRPEYGELREWRTVERVLKRHGSHPKSVWQLSYAGSVGSQALLGIPHVRALRDDPELASVSAVWPFETGFSAPDSAQVVHAEFYPTLAGADPALHPIADARQVLGLVDLLSALDAEDTLRELFSAAPELSEDERSAAVDEEGWILGAPGLVGKSRSVSPAGSRSSSPRSHPTAPSSSTSPSV